MNYQKIVLAGNVTKDAQQRAAKTGDTIFTTFDVAISEGKGKDKTTFFPVVVFGKHGEAVAKYVTKGRLVLIDGRIQVNNKGRFSVVADQVKFGPAPAASKPTE
jgi:single-strand DNA-binding protein